MLHSLMQSNALFSFTPKVLVTPPTWPGTFGH
jgi:hypothetical protein